MGDEVRVTVIAAGFDRWDGEVRASRGRDDRPIARDVFSSDDDLDDDGNFDVPSFLQESSSPPRCGFLIERSVTGARYASGGPIEPTGTWRLARRHLSKMSAAMLSPTVGGCGLSKCMATVASIAMRLESTLQ